MYLARGFREMGMDGGGGGGNSKIYKEMADLSDSSTDWTYEDANSGEAEEKEEAELTM